MEPDPAPPEPVAEAASVSEAWLIAPSELANLREPEAADPVHEQAVEIAAEEAAAEVDAAERSEAGENGPDTRSSEIAGPGDFIEICETEVGVIEEESETAEAGTAGTDEPVIDHEGPGAGRIPTSLTAALREQGHRYPHRVSRRMRRKMRGGPGDERGEKGPDRGDKAASPVQRHP